MRRSDKITGIILNQVILVSLVSGVLACWLHDWTLDTNNEPTFPLPNVTDFNTTDANQSHTYPENATMPEDLKGLTFCDGVNDVLGSIWNFLTYPFKFLSSFDYNYIFSEEPYVGVGVVPYYSPPRFSVIGGHYRVHLGQPRIGIRPENHYPIRLGGQSGLRPGGSRGHYVIHGGSRPQTFRSRHNGRKR